MKKSKIWLLLDSSQSGGIESHVLQLAEGLQQHQQPVEVVFLTDYGDHPMRNALTRKGISNRTLDGRFRTLNNLLKNESPDVLHTHGYKAGILGRFTAWINNITSISTYHAGEIATGKLAIYDWLDRKTALLAKQRFAVSPQIAERLPGKSWVTNNFINSRDLSLSNGKQVAFVGRISHEKGPDLLLSLAVQVSNTQFHVYGDGPLLKALTDNAPANVTFHGQQDDMSKIWPNIGLLVMPSRYEGLPMAALEAMARGIPVVAFKVGALHHLIEPKINGWLAEPENISELVASLEQWECLQSQQKETLQLACVKTIKQRFSSDVAIPKLINNYQSVSC